MKTFSIIFSVLSSFFLLSSWSFAQTIQINPTSSCTSECSEYTFAVTTPFAGFSSNISTLGYFWYFGDGQIGFSANETVSFFNGTPVQETLVYVELTPTGLFSHSGGYGDTEDPKMVVLTSVINNLCNSTSQCLVRPNIPSTTKLALTPNRSLVKGDIVSYIITYSDTCVVPTGTSQVHFWYDPSLLFLESGRDPIHHNQIEAPTFSSEVINSNSFEKLTWNIGNITSNETRHVIVRMEVRDNVAEGTEIFTKSALGNTYDGSQKVCYEIGHTDFSVASHDPNSKSSTPKHWITAPSQNSEITYTIRFQNDGNGAANTVIIKDFIHEDIDLNSIEVIYPVITSGAVQQPPSILNVQTREITWTLSGAFLEQGKMPLMGLEQEGLGTSFGYGETYDYLVFTAKLNKDLKPCEALINRAEIIFAGQDPMFTNPCITPVGCQNSNIDTSGLLKDSTPISYYQPFFDVCLQDSIIPYSGPSLVYSGGSGLVLNYDESLLPHPDDPGAHYFKCYPSYQVDDYTSPHPKVKPCKNLTYYLVAFSKTECRKVIFAFPVSISGEPCKNPWPPRWAWIAFGALILIILAIYTFKKWGP